MFNNRHFSLLYILINNGKTTAKQLAQELEVSVRTIYRDIDVLSSNNIPIFAEQGKNGGISIMGNYVIDKSLFTKEEQYEIIYALQSLNAVNMNENKSTLNKLQALFDNELINWVKIDFTDWSTKDKVVFEKLKTSILESRKVLINYYSSNLQSSTREIVPLQLFFKTKAWYINAYCLLRNEYRVFKLARIKNIELKEQHTLDVSISEFEEQLAMHYGTYYENSEKIILRVDKSSRLVLEEHFEKKSIFENENGSIDIILYIPIDRWLISYILSFGQTLEVVEPIELRQIVALEISNMNNKYI